MTDFTLDTSGRVNLGKASWVGHNEHVEWSDLDPFTRGYVEALFASIHVPGPNGDEGLLYPAFSDLSPEALALILRDCEQAGSLAPARTIGMGETEHGMSALYPPTAFGGRLFWTERQQQSPRRLSLAAFPPLTPYLADDGKVHLKEAA
jgi:hypothetical protein